MARKPREKADKYIPTNYHIMSRTIWQDFLIKDKDKEQFMILLSWLSKTYFVETKAFNILDNHFHLLINIHVPEDVSELEIENRFDNYYQNKKNYNPNEREKLLDRFGDLSCFMKDVKERFAKYINKKNNRKGHFWSGRFKSKILKTDEQLFTCIQYIDLNAVRANIVKYAHDYKFCTPGHIFKTANKPNIINTNQLSIYKNYIPTKSSIAITINLKPNKLNKLPKPVEEYYKNYVIYLAEIADNEKQEKKAQISIK